MDIRSYKRLPNYINLKYQIIRLVDTEKIQLNNNKKVENDNSKFQGLIFRSGEKMALDSFLEIELIIPDVDTAIYLKGRVIRVEEIVYNSSYEIGIEYQFKFPEDEDILKAHLI